MYSFMVFLHIVGVLLMFGAVSLTLAAMVGLLVARHVMILRTWANFAVKMDGLLPPSAVFVIGPGIYLTISAWGWQTAWINMSLVLLLFMCMAGPVINLPRLKRIAAAANEHPLEHMSEALQIECRNVVLWRSVSMMALQLIAIVYMMTMKPSIIGAIVAVMVCMIIGLVLAQFALYSTTKRPEMINNR